MKDSTLKEIDNTHPSELVYITAVPLDSFQQQLSDSWRKRIFRGFNWGSGKLYWKTLASMHIYCSVKIMLLIPQMQLFSQCFWLSFTRYLHALFLAITIASLFRPLLPFPWDNFNNLVFLLILLYSRTTMTDSEKDLSWKSSQSSRKSNMDVDNFNKNVLRYNYINTCKRLGNIF